jgi:hypothetical protein
MCRKILCLCQLQWLLSMSMIGISVPHATVRSSRQAMEILSSFIGPVAKSAALFLRYKIGVSYRKTTEIFRELFGLNLVPASAVGFDRKAALLGSSLHDDLREKYTRSESGLKTHSILQASFKPPEDRGALRLNSYKLCLLPIPQPLKLLCMEIQTDLCYRACSWGLNCYFSLTHVRELHILAVNKFLLIKDI